MVVVGTDTDLLVVMVSLASEHMDLYMFCGRNPKMLYRIINIKMRIGKNSERLLALHALTDSDTVSALYLQGKRKAFNLFNKNECEMLDIFTTETSTHKKVQKVGENFILNLYGVGNYKSFDEFRYISFKKSNW